MAVLQERGESDAFQAIAAMQQGTVVNIDGATAVGAARTSIDLRLPTADSLILAVTRMHKATLWTQDADFENQADVRYRKG